MSKSSSNIVAGDELIVRFESMAAGGACKGTPKGAHPGACSVFTHLAAPGDLASVRVVSVNKRYVNAALENLLEPSPMRAAPKCPIFTECGGCDWQHLPYETQLAQSDELAAYAMKRLGDYENILEPTVPSPSAYGYRTRGDLAATIADGKMRVGFRRRGSHAIVEARACPIMADALSAAIPLVGEIAIAAGLREGMDWRIRVALDEATGRVAVLPAPARGPRPPVPPMYMIDADRRGFALEPDAAPFTLRAGGFELRYHPACFTQVNPGINERLHALVAATLKPISGETVLELYSGIGNFTLPLAASGAAVLASESSELAASYAETNLRAAGLSAMHTSQSALAFCRELARGGRHADKLLADPPREGLGPELAAVVVRLAPRRVAYISCDMESLRADLAMLIKGGYFLRGLTPLDMFPQSWRKEYITVLDA